MIEIEKIRDFLSKAEYDSAIESFKLLTLKTKYEKIFISISAKYQELKIKITQGVINSSEQQIEISQIIVNILSVISDIEKDKISNSINFQLINQTEKDFFEKIDFPNVTEILIIGHTGRKIISELYDKIKNIPISTFNTKLCIKILLREPYSESQDRYSQLNTTLKLIKTLKEKYLNIDVRFYDSLPFYRAILCKYSDNSNYCFISSYQWLETLKTEALKSAFFIKKLNNQIENNYYQLVLSWFNHYWGDKEIHTIIFDFDDTLINSMTIQVKAWYNTIIQFLDSGELKTEYCSDEINKFKGSKSDLKNYIKSVFIEQQMAPLIMKVLFPKLPENGIEKLKDKIEESRFEERVRLTNESSELFEGVKETLIQLKDNYHLVIVSATSESLISDVLTKLKIKEYFPLILGKYGPSLDWENVHEKANHIIKLSRLLGIGTKRMVYIGDNDSDYRATKQIKVKFIECRIIAKLMNLESLVKYENKKDEIYFDSYKDSKLISHLEQLNILLSKSKCKLNTDYMKE